MAISLQRLDEENLERVLLAAVAGAAPGETMPAVPGPPGWTPHHRRRSGPSTASASPGWTAGTAS